MENDPDRELELSLYGGASGLCMRTHDFVICDLEEAKHTYADKWQMTPNQQSLVRPTLKSLLCVPIFDPGQFDSMSARQSKLEEPVLGVLNFDSDANLLYAFDQQAVLDEAALSAKFVACALIGRL